MKVHWDATKLVRLRGRIQIGLILSLITFFVAVVLMGGEIGDPTFAEDLAFLSSLAVALNGLGFLSLGWLAARLSSGQGADQHTHAV